MRNVSRRGSAWGLFALLSAVSAAHGQTVIFDPNSVPLSSSSPFSASTGLWVFDTDALTLSLNGGTPGAFGTLIDGIAVYNFPNITLSGISTVQFVGSRPMALLSRNTISVSQNAVLALDAGGGAGGLGQTTFHGTQTGSPGGGLGGGPGGRRANYDGGKVKYFVSGAFGGGGGTFGGRGTLPGGFVGPVQEYGDLFDQLVGGSGGGGGGQASTTGGLGGRGGGAAMLVAVNQISVINDGYIRANGAPGQQPAAVAGSGNPDRPSAQAGSGGGGSGGGILLSAPTVTVANTGLIGADGAAGAPGRAGGFALLAGQEGGNGGGGRIAIRTGATYILNSPLPSFSGYSVAGAPGANDGRLSFDPAQIVVPSGQAFEMTAPRILVATNPDPLANSPAVNVEIRDLRVSDNASVNFGTAGVMRPSAVLTLDTLGIATVNQSQDIGGLTGSGTVQLASGTSLSVGVAGTSTFSGVVEGPGQLVKRGPGLLHLSSSVTGAVTYTGGTRIEQGTLRVSGATLTGGYEVLADASLEVGDTGNVVLPGNLTGAGRLVKKGFNTLELTGNNDLTGGGVIEEGRLIAAASAVRGAFALTGASSVLEIRQTGDAVYTGSTSGIGAVVKSGPGTLTLGGSFGQSGTTTVAEGTLRGPAGSFPAGITNNAAMVIDQPADGTYTGTIFGSGTVRKTGGGVLTMAGFSGFAGGFFVDAGTLRNTAQISGGGRLQLASGTTLDVRAAVQRAILGLPGSDIVINSSPVTLGASSAFDGFRHSGSLRIGSSAVTILSLGPALLGGFTEVGTPTANGSISAANGVTLPTGAILTARGSINGRFSAAPGALLVATGQLAVGFDHPAGFFSDGELVVGNQFVQIIDRNEAVLGSFTSMTTGGFLFAPNGVYLDFGRNIVGAGTVETGTTLERAMVNNGDIIGNGPGPNDNIRLSGLVKGIGSFTNVQFNGTFAPGLSPGQVVVGGVSLTPGATLDMEIAGSLPGTQHDQLIIREGAQLQLNGTLRLSFLNGYAPQGGDVYQLFSGATTGGFATIQYPPLPDGLRWDPSLLYSQGSVRVLNYVIPEPSMLMPLGVAALLLGRCRRPE
jgi:autotransporter-associated beta strand protein